MSLRSTLRSIARDFTQVWHERRVRFPAFKVAIRQLPAKIRATDPVQRRNLALALIVILGMVLVNFS